MKVVKSLDCPGLGQSIRRARKNLQRKGDVRLSVEKIASKAGMTSANWYKIEGEETKALPIETLRQIEWVLGVDFGVKFDG